MKSNVGICSMKLNEEIVSEFNVENKVGDTLNTTQMGEMEVTQNYLQDDTSRNESGIRPIARGPKLFTIKHIFVVSIAAFVVGCGFTAFFDRAILPAPNFEIHNSFEADILICNKQLETSIAESLTCNNQFETLSKEYLLCSDQVSQCTTETFLLVKELGEIVSGTLQDHQRNLTAICASALTSSCANTIDLSSC